ncbi:MAG: hypothetical protein ABIQ52_15265 [Vicinamibacterales bacterium]
MSRIPSAGGASAAISFVERERRGDAVTLVFRPSTAGGAARPDGGRWYLSKG